MQFSQKQRAIDGALSGSDDLWKRRIEFKPARAVDLASEFTAYKAINRTLKYTYMLLRFDPGKVSLMYVVIA